MPATRRGGTKTIDNVFLSDGLTFKYGGFLGFEDGFPSDHRTLWMDFSIKNLFGFATLPIQTTKKEDLLQTTQEQSQLTWRYSTNI